MDSPEWKLAACKGYDPDVWFPETHHESNTAIPKAICRRCPIRDDCREFAIRNSLVGIWGGEYFGNKVSMKRQRERDAFLAGRERRAVQAIARAYTPGVLGVPCPTCRVPTGEQCRSLSSSAVRTYTRPHKRRLVAADRRARELAGTIPPGMVGVAG